MHTLRITDSQHGQLMCHLLPKDGKEAVAIALCGQANYGVRSASTVFKIVEIPYEECVRSEGRVTWPTQRLRHLIDAAKRSEMRILKIHSHPGGYANFSDRDDTSDRELFGAIARRLSGEHLSAVMLPDGSIFARLVGPRDIGPLIDQIFVVGDSIISWTNGVDKRTAIFDARHRQFFGDKTTELLSQLSIGVVGVSGTGSPTVEMLARLGVKRLILVEPDFVELKNLNRIYGSTAADAKARRNKAHMMKTHIDSLALEQVSRY